MCVCVGVCICVCLFKSLLYVLSFPCPAFDCVTLPFSIPKVSRESPSIGYLFCFFFFLSNWSLFKYNMHIYTPVTVRGILPVYLQVSKPSRIYDTTLSSTRAGKKRVGKIANAHKLVPPWDFQLLPE